MNLMAVDESEILVTVGDRQCNITTRSNNEILCIPPQSGSGSAIFMVCKTVFMQGFTLHYLCASGILWRVPQLYMCRRNRW